MLINCPLKKTRCGQHYTIWHRKLAGSIQLVGNVLVWFQGTVGNHFLFRWSKRALRLANLTSCFVAPLVLSLTTLGAANITQYDIGDWTDQHNGLVVYLFGYIAPWVISFCFDQVSGPCGYKLDFLVLFHLLFWALPHRAQPTLHSTT